MPRRYQVVLMLFLLVVVMYLDRLCIAVAGPRMQKEMGLGPREWGWVIGAFTLAYALFEVPSGALGDRLGPRKVLTRIVLWWSGFTMITGMVSSLNPLLVVRFLFGAGEAGAFPNSTATIARWIPANERGRASSLMWTATAVGGMITPLVVVPLQQAYGWRASFFVFGALGVVWAAVWYWGFRDHPKLGPTHTGVRWAVLLRDPNFLRIMLMYHLYCWGAYFYLSWLHTYLQVGRGLTEDEMKIASALPSTMGLAGTFTGGFLSDRLARTHSLRFARCVIGTVSLFAAGALMLLATVTVNNKLAVGLLAAGLGTMNLMLPVAWAICVDIGGRNPGAVSGAMNMAGQAGSFLSSIAFGYLVTWLGSYDRALMPLAACLIGSGAVFAMIDPGRKLRAVDH